ncbi:hypothetical protein [Rhizobium laguerreae]|uniref:hypothetical protein n=1 Tax=Rhizobium laguerreae TaxID=1076926 RepID=UPI001440FB17|nr:hypothetical protein [Rhizobium laguerreae]NKN08610.1 hypothetical protein [Rhizobium laguerreae]
MYNIPIAFFATFKDIACLVADMEKGRTDEEFIRGILRGTAYCDNQRECFPFLPGDIPARSISTKQMNEMLKCFKDARVSGTVQRPAGYQRSMPLVFSLDWYHMSGNDPRFHPKRLEELERLHQRYQNWRKQNAPPQFYKRGADIVLDQILNARIEAGGSRLLMTNEDDRYTFFKEEVSPLRATGRFNEAFAVLRASLVIVETRRGEDGNAWRLTEDDRMQERARIDSIGHWAGFQAGNDMQRIFFHVHAKRHENVDPLFANFDLTKQRWFDETSDAALRQFQQFTAGIESKVRTYDFLGPTTEAEYGRWLMHTRRQHPEKVVDGVSPRGLLMRAITKNCASDTYSSKEDVATEYTALARGYSAHGEPDNALEFVRCAKELVGDDRRFRFREAGLLQTEGDIHRRLYARTKAAVDRDRATDALTSARNHFAAMGLKKQTGKATRSLAALVR